MKKRRSAFSFLYLLILVSTCCHVKKDFANEKAPAISDEEHQRKEVVIFVYHRFGDNRYPSTNIPVEIFEQHLQYLHDNDFTVRTFGDAVNYMNDNTLPLEEKVACITIDDGYKTFYSNALPLLLKFNFKATLFINSESVGGSSYMTWDELRHVSEQGVEIGNHSHSHSYFLNQDADERLLFFLEDIRMCQKLIKDQLGFYPELFAYPYGEFDTEMKNALKTAGFKAAAAQNSGVFAQGDNHAVPRFPMAGPYANMEGFKEKANMRALRIKSKNTNSFLLEGDNPPQLRIIVDSAGVDVRRANCFTSSACNIRAEGNVITISAEKPLKSRRTLYTITAPSRESGVWHWYSHLWIQPAIAE